jgi:hypothetical protein
MLQIEPSAAEKTASPDGASGLRQGGLSLRGPGLLLIGGVLFAAIFVLPYCVPLSTPNLSLSWEFGFSNAAARGLIAFLLLFLFGWRMLFDRSFARTQPVALSVLGQPAPGRARAFLCTVAALQALACGLLIAWYRYLPYAHFGEMAYFMQRLESMLLGRLPYRDFGFDYGPAMLWGPVALYRASHGGLSIEEAYLIVLLLDYILGFALLAYAVSQVNSRARPILFALLAAPFFIATMGLNYAPLRFAIAPASVLAVRHLFRALDGSRWRLPALAFTAFLLPIANCAISPEMGIAVIAGLSVYFLWFLFGKDRLAALPALGVVAGAAVVAGFFPRGLFDSVFSFGQGGNDFPVLPNAHIVAMLAAATWVLPALGAMAVREGGREGPFCAGFAVAAGFLLVPATGRCDCGHVFFNSLGIFLLALSAATFLGKRWRNFLFVSYSVIFILGGQYLFWTYYTPAFERAFVSRQELARITYISDNGSSIPAPAIHFSKLLPPDPWTDGLPHVPIGLPLGADERTERFLMLTGRALPEYYIAPHADLLEPSQMSRKFADLGNMTYIYVPRFYFKYLAPKDARADAAAHERDDNAYLSKLFCFPTRLTAINPVFEPEEEIMRRIALDFTIVQPGPLGVLLKRSR